MNRNRELGFSKPEVAAGAACDLRKATAMARTGAERALAHPCLLPMGLLDASGRTATPSTARAPPRCFSFTQDAWQQ